MSTMNCKLWTMNCFQTFLGAESLHGARRGDSVAFEFKGKLAILNPLLRRCGLCREEIGRDEPGSGAEQGAGAVAEGVHGLTGGEKIEGQGFRLAAGSGERD